MTGGCVAPLGSSIVMTGRDSWSLGDAGGPEECWLPWTSYWRIRVALDAFLWLQRYSLAYRYLKVSERRTMKRDQLFTPL